VSRYLFVSLYNYNPIIVSNNHILNYTISSISVPGFVIEDEHDFLTFDFILDNLAKKVSHFCPNLMKLLVTSKSSSFECNVNHFAFKFANLLSDRINNQELLTFRVVRVNLLTLSLLCGVTISNLKIVNLKAVDAYTSFLNVSSRMSDSFAGLVSFSDIPKIMNPSFTEISTLEQGTCRFNSKSSVFLKLMSSRGIHATITFN
jgi:hypothetical protein